MLVCKTHVPVMLVEIVNASVLQWQPMQQHAVGKESVYLGGPQPSAVRQGKKNNRLYVFSSITSLLTDSETHIDRAHFYHILND